MIDDERLYNEVRRTSPRSTRISRSPSSTTIPPRPTGCVLREQHVHEQVHKALDRKVWLPSGGSLIIEHTEALTGHRRQHRQERRHLVARGDGLPQQPRGRR
jgi:ribonuclease E